MTGPEEAMPGWQYAARHAINTVPRDRVNEHLTSTHRRIAHSLGRGGLVFVAHMHYAPDMTVERDDWSEEAQVMWIRTGGRLWRVSARGWAPVTDEQLTARQRKEAK